MRDVLIFSVREEGRCLQNQRGLIWDLKQDRWHDVQGQWSQRTAGLALSLRCCKCFSQGMLFLWQGREICGKWSESRLRKGGLQINLTTLVQCLCWMLSFSRLSRERRPAHHRNAYYFFFSGSVKSSPARTSGSRSPVTPTHAPCWWYHITRGSCWSSEPAYKGSGKYRLKTNSAARFEGVTRSISS